MKKPLLFLVLGILGGPVRAEDASPKKPEEVLVRPALSRLEIQAIAAVCAEGKSVVVRLLQGWDAYDRTLEVLFDQLRVEMQTDAARKATNQEFFSTRLEATRKTAQGIFEKFMALPLAGATSEQLSLRKTQALLGLFQLNMKLALTAVGDAKRQFEFVKEARKLVQAADQIVRNVSAEKRAIETPGLLERVTRARIDFETFALSASPHMSARDQLTRFLGVINDSKKLIPRSSGNLPAHFVLEDAQLDILEVQATISVASADPGMLRPTLSLPDKPNARAPAVPSTERFLLLVESLPARRQELQAHFSDANLGASAVMAELTILEIIAPFYLPLYSAERLEKMSQDLRAQLQAEGLKTGDKKLLDRSQQEALVFEALRNAASSMDLAKKNLLEALESNDPVRRDMGERTLRLLANETWGTTLGRDLLLMAARFRHRPVVQYGDILKGHQERSEKFDENINKQLGDVIRKNLALPGIKELVVTGGNLGPIYNEFMDALARIGALARDFENKIAGAEEKVTEQVKSANATWLALQCARVAAGDIRPEELKSTPFSTYAKPDLKLCQLQQRRIASEPVGSTKADRVRWALVHAAPRLVQKEIRYVRNAAYTALGVSAVLMAATGPWAAGIGQAVAAGAARLATTLAMRVSAQIAMNTTLRIVASAANELVIGSLVSGLSTRVLVGARNYIYMAMQGDTRAVNFYGVILGADSAGLWIVKTFVAGLAAAGMSAIWKKTATKFPIFQYAVNDTQGRFASGMWAKYVGMKAATGIWDANFQHVSVIASESLYTGENRFAKAFDKAKPSEIAQDFIKLSLRRDLAGDIGNIGDRMSALRVSPEELKQIGECQECKEKSADKAIDAAAAAAEKGKGPASTPAK